MDHTITNIKFHRIKKTDRRPTESKGIVAIVEFLWDNCLHFRGIAIIRPDKQNPYTIRFPWDMGRFLIEPCDETIFEYIRHVVLREYTLFLEGMRK